ncbi:MAG: LTA synthase family protein [Bacilli bacterium]|nr:LTA synthase family protein [Bacilli bacterium]
MKNKKVLKIIILTICLILIFFSIFMKLRFNNVSFELLLFSIFTSKGGNFDILLYGILFVVSGVLIGLGIIYLLKLFYKKVLNKKISFLDKLSDKKKSIIKLFIYIIIVIISITCLLRILKIDTYIMSQSKETNLFEEYYVDGRDIKITFPEEKRNLIYIYVESLESTNISKKNGGLVKESYIPNLEKLALKNVNFSNSDKIGGALQVNNTDWTMAALISHTSGIPFKISMDTNFYNNYINSFPGVYNLGDILEENGYNNYFMIGSDAEFGGRKSFFETHGNYTIYDYYYAIENKDIEEDYFVWWGYEDKKLFEYAKEKILEANELEEPFNFTLLTVDTHFTDGYMDDSCEEVFDNKYANSFYCSDLKIGEFIDWIKEQDFYENTTIVIVGDHMTMQSNFYELDKNYQRTIYNTFINSKIEPEKEKNRLFSTLDFFPTTLASLGVEIEGNKLGLGVNLFSEEKTLVEKLGLENLNKEISKKSSYYDNIIIGKE